MQIVKLFLLSLGCRANGRNTEQHDTFFGIGNSLSNLLPQIENFGPMEEKYRLIRGEKLQRLMAMQ